MVEEGETIDLSKMELLGEFTIGPDGWMIPKKPEEPRNYFLFVLLGGVVLFILGFTIFCCLTGKGPARLVKESEEVERELTPERVTEKSKESSKASKKNKKKKGKKEQTEAEMDKSINKLGRGLDLDIFELCVACLKVVYMNFERIYSNEQTNLITSIAKQVDSEEEETQQEKPKQEKAQPAKNQQSKSQQSKSQQQEKPKQQEKPQQQEKSQQKKSKKEKSQAKLAETEVQVVESPEPQASESQTKKRKKNKKNKNKEGEQQPAAEEVKETPKETQPQQVRYLLGVHHFCNFLTLIELGGGTNNFGPEGNR